MYLKKKAGDMSKSDKKVQSTIDMGKFVNISFYFLKSCWNELKINIKKQE